MDTVRCFKCGSFCGEVYETNYFQLDAEIYCNLQCYKDQRLKEELNGRSEEVSSSPKRPKRKSKKGSKRPKRR